MNSRTRFPRPVRTFFAAVALLAGTLAHSQTSTPDSLPAARMRALNNSLLSLHGKMQRADANSARALRNQAATVIPQRNAALANLIQTDPHAALKFAFSPELLADLAAKFPHSAAQLESRVTVVGPIEHWVADYSNGSLVWWRMKTAGGTLNLFFANAEPRTLGSGDVLQATGVIASSQMAVEASSIAPAGATAILQSKVDQLTWNTSTPLRAPGSPGVLVLGLIFGLPGLSRQVRHLRAAMRGFFRRVAVCGLVLAVVTFSSAQLSAQNSCSPMGVQQVAVLIVTFPGINVPSFSPSLYDQFFGSIPSLSTYWQEASYGTTSATGNVFGPFTLTNAYTCSNVNQFIDDALSIAAASGVDFNTYNRVNIVFPGMSPSCNWAGLSSIGCYAAATSAGTFNLSASVLDWTKFTLNTIYHENGHQLGLAHSRLRTFGTEVLGAIGATGTLTEYGDHYAAMGAPNPGHYAAGQKAEILGWLASGTTYQTVTGSGTYVLKPYESSAIGLDAIKVQRGTGNPGDYLWIEYRQPIGGFDLTMPYAAEPNGNVFTGALIHYEDAFTGAQTDLLDFTLPDTYADFPALPAGQTWTDSYSDLSLSVVSATAAGLTVNVNYTGTTACTHANPTVTLSPLDPSIYPGNSADYNLTVTSNDSATCTATTFSMSSSQPSGWPTAFSTSALSLGPGQSGSVTMTKTGPAGTPAGTYAADASASNGTYAGAGTANITVMSAPTVTATLSISGTGFTTRSTVPITATVLNGGTPVSGASVTFTLTAPNGAATTQTAITGTAGTVTWNYKISQKSLTGAYYVSAQAGLVSGSRKAASTQSVTSNTVSFTVQ